MVEKYKDNPLEGALEYMVWFFSYTEVDRHLKFYKDTGLVVGDSFNKGMRIEEPSIIGTPSRDNEDLYQLYLSSIDISVEQAWLNNYEFGTFHYRGLMSQYFAGQGKAGQVKEYLKTEKPHVFM